MKKALALALSLLMLLTVAPIALASSSHAKKDVVRSADKRSMAADTKAQDLFMGFEDNEDITGWETIDSDGDGQNWEILDNTDEDHDDIEMYEGNCALFSYSYSNETSSPLTPDNWMLSPAVKISAGMTLSWFDCAQDADWTEENYSVYIGDADAEDVEDFTNEVYNGVPSGIWTQRNVDLAEYAGQTIRIAFRHFDVTDMFALKIDAIKISDDAPVLPYDVDPVLSDAINAGSEKIEVGSYPGDECTWNVVTVDGEAMAASTNQRMPETMCRMVGIVNITEPNKALVFDAKVSSEEGADGLLFYVNGTSYQAISGDADWDTYYYAFKKTGSYLLEWVYVKDDISDEGDDTAWVDALEIIDLEPGENLDNVLNVEGGTLTFVNNGLYTWESVNVDERTAAVSSNQGIANSECILSTNISLEPGDIFSFDIKVDSEEGCDGVMLYFNDDAIWGCAGTYDWDNIFFTNDGDVTLNGTMTWDYIKDYAWDEGEDCAWIDNVYAGPAPELTGIDFGLSDIVVPVGASLSFDILSVPEAAVIDYEQITFAVADESIAVASDYTITGVKAGETKITATYGKFTAELKIVVIDETYVYGNVVSHDDYEGWMALGLKTGMYYEGVAVSSEYDLSDMFAAEYYNGVVYGITTDFKAYTLDVATGEETVYTNCIINCTALDMTFDYSTGLMYILGTESDGDRSLYTMDPNDASTVNHLHSISLDDATMMTLAADLNGVLYSISYEEGGLYTIDPKTGATTRIGQTGIKPYYVQSMTFDHTTETLYWASYSEDGNLYTVDTKTAQVELVAADIGEVCGLHFDYENLPEDRIKVTGIKTDVDTIRLEYDKGVMINAEVAPEDATNKNVSWVSDNTAVAVVNRSGYVMAVGRGVANITVTTKDGGFSATVTVICSFAPVSVVNYDFESDVTDWTFIDADGDGYNWLAMPDGNFDFEGYDGSNGCLASASYINDIGALTPDNWAISPVVSIPENSTLSWYAVGQDAKYAEEKYSVYIGDKDATTVDAFTAEPVYTGTSTSAWTKVTVDLTKYAGQDIRIAFRHYDVTDMYWLKLDLVQISTMSTDGVEIGDANYDGEFNTGDAVFVLQSVVNGVELTGEQQLIANINGDAEVNTGDAVKILKICVNNK